MSEPTFSTLPPVSAAVLEALLQLLSSLLKGLKDRGAEISAEIPPPDFFFLPSAADHGDGWCFRAANPSTTLGFRVLCWAGRMPAQGDKARHPQGLEASG